MSIEEVLSGPPLVRVQHLAANAVRVTHTMAGTQTFPPDRPWLRDVFLPGAVEYQLPSGQLGRAGQAKSAALLQVSIVDGRVNIANAAGNRVFSESLQARTRRNGSIELSLRIRQDEDFYGWGEWFNAFQRRRGTLRLKAHEAPSILQDRRTYSALPFFLSSQGYGFFLLNAHATTWHLRPEHGTLEVLAEGPPADYLVIYGPGFKEILSTYTALTGRPPLVPRWAFGLWGTSFPQEHQDRVVERVEEHRRRDIPLDAVILDYHWEERFHNFRWRPALFPDAAAMLRRLNELGVRTGLIFTPFLNNRNAPFVKVLLNLWLHYVPHGLEHSDERALEEYAEARDRDYLAHPQTRWWFGSGGMIDFTNPEAAAWWNAHLRPLYEQGIAFFKNDDGEYLPARARCSLGLDGHEYHNLYGFYYGRAIYEGMQALALPLVRGLATADQGAEADPVVDREAESYRDEDPPLTPAMIDPAGHLFYVSPSLAATYADAAPSVEARRGATVRRPLIYARAAWAGSQRYPALFLGDQKPSFECIRRTMRAGLNVGLAGFAYWTADVFGLDGRTTPETHLRYAQWALLTPIARYFWRPPEVDDTRFPWSHGPAIEANFRRYAELRYRLLPYYYALAWEASRNGLPIIRPLILEFPTDPRVADVWDQVMLGDRLMLAPITEPAGAHPLSTTRFEAPANGDASLPVGAVTRRIILPAGHRWHDFWSTRSWNGGQNIDYEAPLDRLPILVRGSTILPFGPVLDHIADDHQFQELTFHLWPPYPAQGLVYDDDGQSLAYQAGGFSVTRVLAEGNDQGLTVRIGPAEGHFPGQAGTRNLTLVVHSLPAGPTEVLMDGQRLPQGERAEGSWSYDPEQESATIRFPAAISQEHVVMIGIFAIMRNRNKG
jgi:alpha-glucosidase